MVFDRKKRFAPGPRNSFEVVVHSNGCLKVLRHGTHFASIHDFYASQKTSDDKTCSLS